MAKNIKRTVLSEKSPRNRHIAWAEPKGDSLQLNIFNNGKWRPIAGSGNSSSDSSGCGCNDVVIKGIKNGDNYDYTVEKGNFEEVYNGILSGKVYSFDISSFDNVDEDDGTFIYSVTNPIANKSGKYSVAAEASRPLIEIGVGSITFIWTPEGIIRQDGSR